MKNNKVLKPILGILLAVVLLIAVVGVVLFACDGNKITLLETETTLNLQDTYQIEWEGTYENMTFTSDNEEVAVVDSNGLVTAVEVGVAKITVTSDKTSAVFTVTVEELLGDKVPFIVLENDTIDMFPGSLYTAKPVLMIGSAPRKNATFTWTSADPTVATVENGAITAVGVGTTTITVASTKYDGAEKTITVIVKNDYTLDLSEPNLTLGVAKLYGYEKSIQISLVAKEKGVKVENPEITVQADKSIATHVLKDGTITFTGVKAGSFNAVVTWKYKDDEIRTEIPINVVKPRTTTESRYAFDLSKVKAMSVDLKYVVGANLPSGATASKIVSVTDENGYKFTISSRSGSKVTLKGTPNYSVNAEHHTLFVEFDTFILELPIEVVTLAIRTTDDFASLYKYYDKTAKSITGMYILCNDLDFAGKPGVDTFCGYHANSSGGYAGWRAVFDGRGHVIRNLILNAGDHGGIFGTLADGATVKNVAFVNGVNNATAGGYLFNYLYGIVENVFVSANASLGANASNPAAVLAQRLTRNFARLNNVVVVPTNELSGFNYALYGTIRKTDDFKDIYSGTTIVLNAPDTQISTGFKTAQEHMASSPNLTILTPDKTTDAVKLAAGSTTFAEKDGIFYAYYNGKVVYTKSTKLNVPVYDYSLTNNQIDFSKISGFDASKITGLTHLDGTKINYTKSGSVFTIKGDVILNADAMSASGAVTTILVKTGNKTTQLNLKVVTMAIRTYEDFLAIRDLYDSENKRIVGYYVLSNDIDFAGKDPVTSFCHYSWKTDDMEKHQGQSGAVGWCGIFDGQNHIIKNLTLIGNGQDGLFGVVGFSGVVKNLALVNASNQAGGGLLFNQVFGTAENIFVSGTVTNGFGTSSTGAASLFAQHLNDNNGSVKNVTVVALSDPSGMNFGLSANGVAKDKGEDGFQSCVTGTAIVIGVSENQIANGYTTLKGIQKHASNVTAYSDVMAAAKASLKANGKTTFAYKNNIFRIYFDGTEVYKREFGQALPTYNYGLNTGTVDFSQITGVNVADITAITHTNGTAINYTVNGNVVAFTNDAVLNAKPTSAYGAVVNVLVKTAKKTYELPLKVCSMVIRTADDFYSLSSFVDATTKDITGYYLLANDIDCSSKGDFVSLCPRGKESEGGCGVYDSDGWLGTFDGNNHIIKGLKNTGWHPGIFGQIGVTGVVKNVAFVDAVSQGWGGFLAEDVYGTMENILVTGVATKVYANQNNYDVCTLVAGALDKNATIKNITVIATANFGNNIYSFTSDTVEDRLDGTVVVIGPDDTHLNRLYANAAELNAASTHMKAYASAAAAAKDSTLTANGAATFSEADRVFTVKWNGKTVYSVENVLELDKMDYSLTDKKIDLGSISGLNASITGITHADGTAIPYTVSGNVITIGDDPKNILDAAPNTANGATANVYVLTAETKYKLPLTVCTLLIRTPEEFLTLPSYYDATTEAQKGYFVLCNDLDFTGKANYVGAGYIGGASWAKGFVGTFDGRNHIVKNLTIDATSPCGVFGWIGGDSLVKDVAFVDITHNGAGGAIIHASLSPFENVLVTGKLGGSAGTGKALFANILNHNYPKTKNITVIATEAPTGLQHRVISRWEGFKQITGTLIAIGAGSEDKFSGLADMAAITANNANVKPYLTVANAASANLAANGSATFEAASGIFTVKWNGTSIYTAEYSTDVEIEDAYDYSLSNKTIDLSKIPELSGKTITGLTHTDGTAIPYTLDGTVITIGDDAKDILDAAADTATGATTTVWVLTPEGKHILSLKVFTLAIRTPEEFLTLPSYYDATTQAQKGYFVLCNDIDMTGKANYVGTGYITNDAKWAKGFNGTFDGRNHIIKNLTIDATSTAGVFGWIGGDGVVKDVAFVNLTNNADVGAIIYSAINKVENVLVTGKLGGGAGSKTLFSTIMTRNYPNTKNITIIATEALTQTNYRLISRWEGFAQFGGTVVAIGAGAENKFASDNYPTIASITAANANIKPYLTASDAAADTTLTSNGSATFTRAGGSFAVLWNGITVYGAEIINDATAYDYSLSNKAIDLSKIPELNGKTVIGITHEDGTVIPYTASGSVITIGDDSKDVLDAVATTATGATTNVIVITAEGQYKLPLRVVTLAIRTADDFYSLSNYVDPTTKDITGYYFLVNDIDCSSKDPFASLCPRNVTGVYDSDGWLGIFDGNNHVIKGLKNQSSSWYPGIFGQIGKTGVIKNVAFVGAVSQGWGGFLAEDVYGTMENVLVTGVATKVYTGAITADLCTLVAGKFDKNAVIKNITVIAADNFGNNIYSLSADVIADRLDGTTVVIGPDDTHLNYTYANAAALNAASTHMKAYASVAAATADATLTSNGSATFVRNNGAFNVLWNGANVYGVEVVNDATAYDYSLSNKAIDLSKIPELSGKTVTGLTHEDGTAIPYTTNGNVITVGDDTKDILDAAPRSATGATTNVLVSTSGGKYKLPLNVYSLVITSAAEFESMYEAPYYDNSVSTAIGITGYYILGNDIDFAGREALNPIKISSTKGNAGSGWGKGWNATFDGRGYKIENLTLAAKIWDTGVFGNLAGTVKNVAFINATVNGYGGGVLADTIYGTVENVLIVGKVTNPNTSAASTYTSMLGECVDGYGTIKNVTLIATQAPVNLNWMISCKATLPKTVENLIVIGAGSEDKISNGYTTIADIVAANANIKPYLTAADAAADTTLTSSGWSTFETSGTTFNVKWNGTTVYTATVG